MGILHDVCFTAEHEPALQTEPQQVVDTVHEQRYFVLPDLACAIVSEHLGEDLHHARASSPAPAPAPALFLPGCLVIKVQEVDLSRANCVCVCLVVVQHVLSPRGHNAVELGGVDQVQHEVPIRLQPVVHVEQRGLFVFEKVDALVQAKDVRKDVLLKGHWRLDVAHVEVWLQSRVALAGERDHARTNVHPVDHESPLRECVCHMGRSAAQIKNAAAAATGAAHLGHPDDRVHDEGRRDLGLVQDVVDLPVELVEDVSVPLENKHLVLLEPFAARRRHIGVV